MTKTALLKKVGTRIAAIRKRQDLSQSDLARLAGKDRQSIHKVEKGIMNPSIFYLSEIADALTVKLSDLVDLE